jgi:hypothetical protein
MTTPSPKPELVPTPRTDAEVDRNNTRPTGCVPSSFARTLERVINTCASMLGATDENIEKWTLDELEAFMMMRIAKLQEANSKLHPTIAGLRD